jgi:hypothetical protein
MPGPLWNPPIVDTFFLAAGVKLQFGRPPLGQIRMSMIDQDRSQGLRLANSRAHAVFSHSGKGCVVARVRFLMLRYDGSSRSAGCFRCYRLQEQGRIESGDCP